ncbi:hypothetical protein L1887_09351 [Cichorium endivia]|nr:hypothetical protein L1887_09351 [Cichorium endivia]
MQQSLVMDYGDPDQWFFLFLDKTKKKEEIMSPHVFEYALKVAKEQLKETKNETVDALRTGAQAMKYMYTDDVDQIMDELNKQINYPWNFSSLCWREHQDLLTASRCPFVVGLFPPLPVESSKSSKFSSIGSRFKEPSVQQSLITSDV